jgi:RNA polymerase sigma-70 factor (ECF subfamily)
MRDQPERPERPPDPPTLPPNWVDAYKTYIRFWINLARTIRVSDEEAKDIVHGVIASSLANTGKEFHSLEHIRNYVAKGVLNRALQVRHRAGRLAPITEHLESVFAVLPDETAPDSPNIRRALREGIERLPRNDFEIVKLRYYSGLTFSEISQMLQMPVSTLKSREEAALKRIRKWLRKKGL